MTGCSLAPGPSQLFNTHAKRATLKSWEGPGARLERLTVDT